MTLWATWRSGYAAACKAVYTGSIPVVALRAWAAGSVPVRVAVRVELLHERAHATGDLVARGAHRRERLALRVRQVPVEVALAGDVGAAVAAAHRDDHVGLRGELGREQLRPAAGEVD